MEIKQKILDSIKWAQENLGFTLISEDWGDTTKMCTCAMGCVLLKNNPQDMVIIESKGENVAEAAEILGVNEKWVSSFIDGFDGNGTANSSENPGAFALGEQVAKETNPISHGEFLDSLKEDND
jgi:hypothetical protein